MPSEEFVIRPKQMTPFAVEGVPGCTVLSITRPGRDSIERTTVEITSYESGGRHEPNSHENDEQIYYVLEGVMRVVVDGEEYTVNPGDFVRIPRNVAHSHRNAGSGRMTYILISTDLTQ